LPDTNYKSSNFSVADDGTVSQITTGASYAWSYANCIFKTTLPAGTYTAIEELVTGSTNASHGVQVFNSSDVRITFVSGGAKTAGTYSSTFTLSEKTDIGIVCKLYNGKAKLYIVSGSASTTYEPYNGTTYTASLGRTIYGGTADVVNGEGTETYQTIQVGELTFAKVATHTFRCNNFDRVFGNGKYNIFSSQFATYTQGHSTASNIATLEQGNDNTIFLNGGSGTFYISTDSSFDDKTVADFITAYGNTELIYEASTPTDFTFTPITPTPETALGVNNFWSDSGDTEVIYYAYAD
jgi:hypothetical protein